LPEAIPIACSLDQAERPARAERMAALGRDLEAVDVDGREASLRFIADRRQALEDFVRAESVCCPFFSLEIVAEPDRVRLEVSAPEDAEWAVRGLVAGFVAGWGGLV
jgi:hypothetical protein